MPNKILPTETAPLADSISALADWVELHVLLSDLCMFNLRKVVSMVDEYEDEENSDFCEQDSTNEDIEGRLVEELAYRESVLKEAYPFSLSTDDSRLNLDLDDNIGKWIYLYCLLISHPKPDGVSKSELGLDGSERDLLQIASVFAAYGHLGAAYSFGWPRRDEANFLAALKKVFAQIGEGVTLNAFKPGHSPYVKDGEVDVIGWQPMNDGMPGQIFLLGQAASGLNWKDKSIIGAIDPFKDAYFSDHPKSQHIPAMFIPFCIDEEFNGSRRDVMSKLTKQYGIVYHRLRLPFYAMKGGSRDEKPPRWRDANKFKAFVNKALGRQLIQAT